MNTTSGIPHDTEIEISQDFTLEMYGLTFIIGVTAGYCTVEKEIQSLTIHWDDAVIEDEEGYIYPVKLSARHRRESMKEQLMPIILEACEAKHERLVMND